jgi:hypothetical protein
MHLDLWHIGYTQHLLPIEVRLNHDTVFDTDVVGKHRG